MSSSVEINYNIGETTLEVNNKRILKGTFTYFSALTRKFVKLYNQQDIPLNDLVISYIWSCQNVQDAHGETFNIIQQFQATPIFHYFSLESFITKDDLFVGKLLFSALLIPYFKQYNELIQITDVSKFINILSHAYEQFNGIYQKVISNAIYHIMQLNKCNKHQSKLVEIPTVKLTNIKINKPQYNPFDDVFATFELGYKETIVLKEETLKKGSIARFLDAIGQSEITCELNEEITVLINQIIPTMMSPNFAFFDFFNQPNQWLKELNLAKIYTFALYLSKIKNNSSKQDDYLNMQSQLALALDRISSDSAKYIKSRLI